MMLYVEAISSIYFNITNVYLIANHRFIIFL